MLCKMKPSVVILLIILSVNALAQTIQGTLVGMANMPIRMEIFNGFSTVTVEQTYCDEKGAFHFNYTNHQNAICFLKSVDEVPLSLLLVGEQISLEGIALSRPESIIITKGDNNIVLDRYKKEILKMEQAYDAWMFLHDLYFNSDVKSTKNAIDEEISRIEKQEEQFIKNLTEGTYLKWYVQQKRLIKMAGIAARYPRDKITSTLSILRAVNYADEKWYASGLMKDIVALVGSSNKIEYLKTYPVPTSDQLNVVFSSLNGGIYYLKLLTMDGKEVYTALLPTMIGDNQFKLNLGSYPAGSYIVKVTDSAGESHSSTVVKSK